MIYNRTFHIQAAHFNNSETYDRVWEIAANTDKTPSRGLLFKSLTDIHGHNFKIEISLLGTYAEKDDFIVDDVELAAVVMGWDSTNLSMHPDFFDKRIRATTENMASVLCDKIRKLPRLHNLKDDYDFDLSVRVYETDDIYAEADE